MVLLYAQVLTLLAAVSRASAVQAPSKEDTGKHEVWREQQPSDVGWSRKARRMGSSRFCTEANGARGGKREAGSARREEEEAAPWGRRRKAALRERRHAGKEEEETGVSPRWPLNPCTLERTLEIGSGLQGVFVWFSKL
jgi:hypothetical protein